MTRLSVNINKVATLRNARGGKMPDVVQFALDCERFGAQGITVHPRPDERHITTEDVFNLQKVITTEFNIEGYPDTRYLELIRATKPVQATLVPDPPGVITSNAGWNTKKHKDFLKEIIQEIHSLNIRSSIFIEPDIDLIEYAAEIGVDRIELYTGPFAELGYRNKEKAISPYISAAETAKKCGLKINAGHDLNLDNLAYFKQNLCQLDEVSIGHAIISDALYFGIENTIQQYLHKLR
ncbi:MAG: pyridoxine 5'-phosphate synthase [Bacteroidetes bacterium]|nr:pyridoxine 5'-phosphate synthase [Bacteroidota bacterium]